jgi:altronate hydrolase
MNSPKDPQPFIRINCSDNIGVALRLLRKGKRFDGFPATVQDDIPAGHKIALADIPAEEPVIKYGYPIGAAFVPVRAGAHVHTHNLRTFLAEAPSYRYTPTADQQAVPAAEQAAVPEISAFRRRDGQIGIRNELWIIPIMGCVNHTAEVLARWADREFAGEAIDGVYAWTHPYGCSQMGNDHETTRTVLADLAKHPNAAVVLILALGCENNTMASFKQALGSYAEDTDRMAFLVTQDWEDEIAEGKKLLTALVGRVRDVITRTGASVILIEVPEMFGAEQMLMDRCESRELFDKTVSLIEDFKEYYRSHNQVVYEHFQ